MNLERTDVLTAQHVEVALVFQKMLGTRDAEEYLRNARVPWDVIARVLYSRQIRQRPSSHDGGDT